MEEAFWDGVMESLKEAEPDYNWAVQLVREVRDEISEMAPESWKQEIVEAIDLDILIQSGSLDVGYLGKILEFALGTLQKLASAVHEDELKVTHKKLLKELTETCQTRDHSKFSHATAMVKGLRFVLEQIQALKQEISKAHIRMMEPLLKGPAGLNYLRKGFANRYGSHEHACVSMPLTRQWLSSVRNCKDQEWEDYNNSVSALKSCASSSQGQQKTGPPQIVRVDKAFKLAEHWVNDMSKSIDDDDEAEREAEGRPDRLGLGAKVVRQSKVRPSNDPVERKLRAKLELGKRKAAKTNEGSIDSARNGNDERDDDSDNESESRTRAFAKKRGPVAPSVQVKKKMK